MNAVLILSGGSGTRFQSALPKQYHKIGGKMVIEYVVEAAMASRLADAVIIVGAACKPLDALQKKYNLQTAPGGSTRNESLKNGLDALFALGAERVIVLDAVRPLVTGALIDEYFSLIINGWDAVTTAQPITDSLGCLDSHTCDRSRYYLMQSPEAYAFDLLFRSFRADSPLTEVAQQLPEGSRLYLYRNFPLNPKLTYPFEKAYIAQALKAEKAKQTRLNPPSRRQV